jgi:predicted GIY-YIG superfamily endonuclease
MIMQRHEIPRAYFVYVFSYLDQGIIRYYIGQTSNLLQRLSNHRTNYKNMRRSIKVCGLKQVKNRDDALKLEQVLCRIYVQYGSDGLRAAFDTIDGCWLD